jgi:hypothetical protein
VIQCCAKVPAGMPIGHVGGYEHMRELRTNCGCRQAMPCFGSGYHPSMMACVHRSEHVVKPCVSLHLVDPCHRLSDPVALRQSPHLLAAGPAVLAAT